MLFRSEYPVLTLRVYAGDLGIDNGTPRSVYTLDPTGMTQIAGGDSGTPALRLMPGETQDLPNGLGTITFENEAPAGSTGYAGSVKRFASLSIHRDLAGLRDRHIDRVPVVAGRCGDRAGIGFGGTGLRGEPEGVTARRGADAPGEPQ